MQRLMTPAKGGSKAMGVTRALSRRASKAIAVVTSSPSRTSDLIRQLSRSGSRRSRTSKDSWTNAASYRSDRLTDPDGHITYCPSPAKPKDEALTA